MTEVRLSVSPKEPVFLCAAICEASITNNKALPVLRHLWQKTSQSSHVTYVPLKVQRFDTLRLYLCTQSGALANITGETVVSLHLQ